MSDKANDGRVRTPSCFRNILKTLILTIPPALETTCDLRKYNIMELDQARLGNHYPINLVKQPEAITVSTERNEQLAEAAAPAPRSVHRNFNLTLPIRYFIY